jgi:Rrf2 family protein
MDVVLARRTDYAIRAILDVARHDGALRKAREISDAMEISPNYLARILATLVNGGMLHATAGPAGGYRLTRPAS